MHCPDRPARGSTKVVVYVAVIKTDDKVKSLRTDRIAFVERARPIGAVIANEAEFVIHTAARCRQEYTIAITPSEQASFHPVSSWSL